jgi:hypothetical protein
MLHLFHSTLHLIDTIATIFLVAFGAIALPSFLIGGISLAADRHRQGKQTIAVQEVIGPAEAPRLTAPVAHERVTVKASEIEDKRQPTQRLKSPVKASIRDFLIQQYGND